MPGNTAGARLYPRSPFVPAQPILEKLMSLTPGAQRILAQTSPARLRRLQTALDAPQEDDSAEIKRRLDALERQLGLCPSGDPNEAPSLRPSLQSAPVLLVDDDEDVRTFLAMILEESGLRVLCAPDGHAAADLLRAEPEIGLALLDVKMPELDGPATLILLRKIQPRLKCCFVTGETGLYTVPALLGMGVQAVFEKPVLVPDMVQAVKELLEGRAEGLAPDGNLTS
jgi:CheY-like chemotaxis protein